MIKNKKVNITTYIKRTILLQDIIFDLKEVLKHYTNKRLFLYEGGNDKAVEVLRKHKKQLNVIYDELAAAENKL